MSPSSSAVPAAPETIVYGTAGADADQHSTRRAMEPPKPPRRNGHWPKPSSDVFGGSNVSSGRAAICDRKGIDARDYALAEAADPLFGAWGVGITVAIAVIATLSGLLASLFSVSRLYGMLQEMKQAPSLPARVPHQPLLITAGAAIILTAVLDLSRIAALGVFLYLTMDIAVQWGVLRRLRDKINAQRWLPIATIVLDVAILAAFTISKAQSDLPTVAVAAGLAAVIFAAQAWVVARRTRRETSDR